MRQYNVTGMSCAACSARVEKAVGKVPGVTACSVSLLTNSMGVEGTAEPSAIIAAVEAACFPPAEAATEAQFAERIRHYGNHFWLMFDGEKLIAFVDGMATNQEDLTDEMYEKAEMHDEKGEWQMIFGVNTLPSYRKHGYAGELIKRAIADAKEQGRKGLVLTCKDRLISYYARFGFKNEGVSESVHGNVVWNQMRLTFDEGLGE